MRVPTSFTADNPYTHTRRTPKLITSACTHTYIHTHTHTHTYIHTYIHTHIHTHIHTYIHTHTHTYIHTYIHTHIHTYIHTHTHTHTHTHIHPYTHTRRTPKLITSACTADLILLWPWGEWCPAPVTHSRRSSTLFAKNLSNL